MSILVRNRRTYEENSKTFEQTGNKKEWCDINQNRCQSTVAFHEPRDESVYENNKEPKYIQYAQRGCTNVNSTNVEDELWYKRYN